MHHLAESTGSGEVRAHSRAGRHRRGGPVRHLRVLRGGEGDVTGKPRDGGAPHAWRGPGRLGGGRVSPLRLPPPSSSRSCPECRPRAGARLASCTDTPFSLVLSEEPRPSAAHARSSLALASTGSTWRRLGETSRSQTRPRGADARSGA